MTLRVRRPNLPLRGIRVVEYPTEFPPREVLEQKLKGGGGDCTRAVGGDEIAAVSAEEFVARPSCVGCRNCNYGDLCEVNQRED